MKRILSALLFVLLVLSAGAVFAEAEEPAAVPEAEEAAFVCGHDNTETIRYFDEPVYAPQDELYHLVYGPATLAVVCDDCGQVLSTTREDYAEEIWPHVFHKGMCVLCGYEQPLEPVQETVSADEAPVEDASVQKTSEAPAEAAAPAQQESVITLSAGGNPSDQYFCTLTGRDLEQAGDTLVLRPEGSDTAIVLQTDQFLDTVDRSGGTFTAEIRKPGIQDINASVRVYDADGTETTPAGNGISLRIYRENNGDPLTVYYTDTQGSVSSAEARWVEGEGYWIVTWRGNGLYEY